MYKIRVIKHNKFQLDAREKIETGNPDADITVSHLVMRIKTQLFVFVELLIYMATDMMYTNKLKLHHKVTSYYTKHRN